MRSTVVRGLNPRGTQKRESPPIRVSRGSSVDKVAYLPLKSREDPTDGRTGQMQQNQGREEQGGLKE